MHKIQNIRSLSVRGSKFSSKHFCRLDEGKREKGKVERELFVIRNYEKQDGCLLVKLACISML